MCGILNLPPDVDLEKGQDLYLLWGSAAISPVGLSELCPHESFVVSH